MNEKETIVNLLKEQKTDSFKEKKNEQQNESFCWVKNEEYGTSSFFERTCRTLKTHNYHGKIGDKVNFLFCETVWKTVTETRQSGITLL